MTPSRSIPSVQAGACRAGPLPPPFGSGAATAAAADTDGGAGFPSWARPVALTRVGVVATLLAAGVSALVALWWWGWMQGAGLWALLACLLPAAGVGVLACTRQTDRVQYLMRLVAALLMLPIGTLFAAADASGPWTAVTVSALVACALVHAAGFVAFIVWASEAATRVHSGVCVAPAAAAAAMARALHTLAMLQPALEARPDAQGLCWTVRHGIGPGPGPGRQHRVELRIDPQRGELRLREFLGADATRPHDAQEASMRGPGDAAFDPARPSADHVWSSTWQAGLLNAARLRRAAQAEHVAGDAEALVHLLAVLALRSGLTWQPTLRRP